MEYFKYVKEDASVGKLFDEKLKEMKVFISLRQCMFEFRVIPDPEFKITAEGDMMDDIVTCSVVFVLSDDIRLLIDKGCRGYQKAKESVIRFTQANYDGLRHAKNVLLPMLNGNIQNIAVLHGEEAAMDMIQTAYNDDPWILLPGYQNFNGTTFTDITKICFDAIKDKINELAHKAKEIEED